MLAAMPRHTTADLVRPSRRPGVAMLALLWLLIALLPLRALSQELMSAAQRSAQPAGVQGAAMPCHGGVAHAGVDGPALHHASAADAAVTSDLADIADVADVAEAVDAVDGVASDEPASNCSACDLCHAALAGPMDVRQALGLPAAQGQVATPSGPSAAVSPDGIFKPPRA